MTDAETHEITLTESDRRGRYAMLHEDGRESELTYAIRDGAIALDHTFTPRDLRHQKAAIRLLEFAVADLRERGLKAIPVCPYVTLQFERHPEWADLLA